MLRERADSRWRRAARSRRRRRGSCVPRAARSPSCRNSIRRRSMPEVAAVLLPGRELKPFRRDRHGADRVVRHRNRRRHRDGS